MEHPPALAGWHDFVRTGDATALRALLATEAVFFSPVVHRPQAGVERTLAYLVAARQVFGRWDFAYRREVVDPPHAVLEFTAKAGDTEINGIDFITWDADDRIVEFKVMLRPQRALAVVQEAMAAMLAAAG